MPTSRRRKPKRRPPSRTASSGHAGSAGPATGRFDFADRLEGSIWNPHPMALLGQASALLNVFDPRTQGLGEPDLDDEDAEPERPDPSGFLAALEADGSANSHALLLAMSVMLPDVTAGARARAAVRRRHTPVPLWLHRVHETSVRHAHLLRDALQDGETVFLEVVLPGGENVVAVYIDHNMGGVVKDGFALDAPWREVVQGATSALVPGQRIDDLPLADARARIEAAIAEAARSLHTIEDTDEWPGLRPFVEWLVRGLPDGGSVPAVPEWSDERLAELADQFLASTAGADLQDPDDPDVVRTLLALEARHPPGDPLRFSPVSIEMLLVDRLPRTVLADRRWRERVPVVLRALVPYAHRMRGVPPERADESFESLDTFLPVYFRTSDSALAVADFEQQILRNQALIAGLTSGDPRQRAEAMRLLLADAVGGLEQLEALDADPLQPEPFAAGDLPPAVRDRVERIAALVTRCAEEFFGDAELGVAGRRLLLRAATASSSPFGPRTNEARTAAAVCWIVAKVNDALGPPDRRVKDLTAWFGITGAVRDQADRLLRSLGLQSPIDRGLGDPSLLTSARRRRLIDDRDRLATPG